MSASAEQNLSNHARYVPGFHFVTGTLTIIVAFWALYRVVTLRTSDTVLEALIGFALVGQFWYLRAFPVKVQDRLIRLEERLRIQSVLPSDLQRRCDSLTADQLIALRFASDGELPALTKKVLDERITDRKAIKSLVVNWRPDNMRA